MSPLYHFDSFTIFAETLAVEGWLFVPERTVASLQVEHPGDGSRLRLDYGRPSDDVVAAYGAAARACRFSYRGPSPFAPDGTTALVLRIETADGDIHHESGFIETTLLREPVHHLFALFMGEIRRLPAGRVLELGARARSGNTRRHMMPPQLEYLGMDILDGPNVDLVADAHSLSRHIAPGSLDAVFSFSVFEHLLMPWKVAIELNRVLKPGGLGLIVTHQAWPVHDAPCDYWRFSDRAWHGLFNAATGFVIVESRMSDPAYLVPKVAHPHRFTYQTPDNFQQSAVLFRKIGETKLEWEVENKALEAGVYPA